MQVFHSFVHFFSTSDMLWRHLWTIHPWIAGNSWKSRCQWQISSMSTHSSLISLLHHFIILLAYPNGKTRCQGHVSGIFFSHFVFHSSPLTSFFIGVLGGQRTSNDLERTNGPGSTGATHAKGSGSLFADIEWKNNEIDQGGLGCFGYSGCWSSSWSLFFYSFSIFWLGNHTTFAGTGDAHLSLTQRVPLDGAVIVSTPQEIALLDARRFSLLFCNWFISYYCYCRGVTMFQRVNVPIFGFVENMCYFQCSCGERTHIFGQGGCCALAKEVCRGLTETVGFFF